jgi:hypothetical protein
MRRKRGKQAQPRALTDEELASWRAAEDARWKRLELESGGRIQRGKLRDVYDAAREIIRANGLNRCSSSATLRTSTSSSSS